MKESAIEWLLSMLDYNEKMLGIKEIIEHAKKMEKEQVIDAVKDSWNMAKHSNFDNHQAEQYYNTTFKNTDK